MNVCLPNQTLWWQLLPKTAVDDQQWGKLWCLLKCWRRLRGLGFVGPFFEEDIFSLSVSEPSVVVVELVNIRRTLSCNQGHTLTKTRGTVFKEFLKDKFKGHCHVSILGYLSVKEQTNNQSPHARHCRRLLSPNLWRFCWGAQPPEPQPRCTSFFNLAAVLGLTWIYMKQVFPKFLLAQHISRSNFNVRLGVWMM